MKKKDNIGLLLAGALLGGAAYFLFYTDRGRQMQEQITDLATEKVDEWLAKLENFLEEKEQEAEQNEAAEPA